MAISSKIIFCKNIKLDRNNNNVLTLSEADMLTLINSNGIKVAESTNYSFIGRGDRDAIDVSLAYNTLLGCNYIAFQNTNYNNKWYFAFIDKIEFINDGVSRVHYTVDIFATWWSYWSPKACFVFREHVNDDTVGSNLIDEGLYLGEFKVNKVNKELAPFGNCKPVLAVSELIGGPNVMDPVPEFYEHGNIFNGICYIVGETSPYMTSHIVRAYDENGKADAIQYIFMAPYELAANGLTHIYQIHGFDYTVNYSIIDASSASYNVDFGGNDFRKPTTIDGYTPVNKKLLTSPYCYLVVDPHTGNSYNFNYEDFSTNFYGFSVDAVLTPGCSVKITPINYKGATTNYLYSFAGAKFPMCSWNSDAYTNWLTQNGVDLGFTTLNKNEAAGIASIGSMLLGGVMMATGVGSAVGASLMLGGAAGIFNSMQSNYQASLMPDQVKGNSSIGDINYSLKLYNPICYEMSIKREIAVSIDSYFSKFGYKVNKTKIPNQTGRSTWNYVQIGTEEILAYQKTDVVAIPAQDLININKLYQRGITLWHSHTTLGDYTQSNTITS